MTRVMKKNILLMYGLFLGWAEILFNQIFTEQSLDILQIIIILIPLVTFFVVALKWKKINIEKLPILETTAFCIALMVIYFFLYNIVPPSIKYIFIVILFISIGFMTLTMLVSFKYYSFSVITMTDAIKSMAIILFINTTVTLIYKIVSFLNILFLEGVILFIIICLYYWYFLNSKEKRNILLSIDSIKIPKKILVYIAAFLLLLSLGYGPFLSDTRNEIVQSYTFAFVYIRIAYLLSLVVTYKCIEKFKNNLEIVLMFFAANLVIINLISNYIDNPVANLIFCLIAQFSYATIHCFLGALFIMIGYLYTDTSRNVLIAILIAFFSMIVGVLIPDYTIGSTALNIFITLITTVISMVLITILKIEVLDEFKVIINNITREQNRIDKIQQIEDFDILTQRENEVLGYLVLNYTNKDTAEKLMISENTLKKHARNIYSKLNVKNKKELNALIEEW